MSGLLVVAGEASGDRAAATVVTRMPGVQPFGLGGPALAAAGCDLVADIRMSTAMGIGEVAMRALGIRRAWRAVVRAVHARRPTAALLVNYSEYNGRLARKLHGTGVRVLWYGPPQVWAWRAGRLRTLGPFIDRAALMLPFEEAIWRRAGVDARYVGHPAFETALIDRKAARQALRLTGSGPTIAILPGSRPHEVRRLLEPMLAAWQRLRAGRSETDARVLFATALDEATQSWARAQCESAHVPWFDVDACGGAMSVLKAFDVAVCASGTVTLEAALARVVPVVAYRVGLATELTARALVRTPHVALPNILLGRRAFTELLQREVRPDRLADALGDALDRHALLLRACDEVALAMGSARSPSAEVARMLGPWL